MLIFREKAPLTAYLSDVRARGARIGFVPTMGALHPGHLSLLDAARLHADTVVLSIFVNPTQFNDPEDFKKYPVRTDEDIRLLLDSPAEVLYLPGVEEIYGQGTRELPHYDFGRLETLWEGAHRPGHFQGVGQVMERLLRQVPADYLVMGQKDYQQILIVNKLIQLLDFKIEMLTCPILREADGLAMSSRNLRLSPGARAVAPQLYQTLGFIGEHFREKPFETLLSEGALRLEKAGFQLDYLAITGPDLEPLSHLHDGHMVCLVAAWLDGVRLIDNLSLH